MRLLCSIGLVLCFVYEASSQEGPPVRATTPDYYIPMCVQGRAESEYVHTAAMFFNGSVYGERCICRIFVDQEARMSVYFSEPPSDGQGVQFGFEGQSTNNIYEYAEAATLGSGFYSPGGPNGGSTVYFLQNRRPTHVVMILYPDVPSIKLKYRYNCQVATKLDVSSDDIEPDPPESTPNNGAIIGTIFGLLGLGLIATGLIFVYIRWVNRSRNSRSRRRERRDRHDHESSHDPVPGYQHDNPVYATFSDIFNSIPINTDSQQFKGHVSSGNGSSNGPNKPVDTDSNHKEGVLICTPEQHVRYNATVSPDEPQLNLALAAGYENLAVKPTSREINVDVEQNGESQDSTPYKRDSTDSHVYEPVEISRDYSAELFPPGTSSNEIASQDEIASQNKIASQDEIASQDDAVKPSSPAASAIGSPASSDYGAIASAVSKTDYDGHNSPEASPAHSNRQNDKREPSDNSQEVSVSEASPAHSNASSNSYGIITPRASFAAESNDGCQTGAKGLKREENSEEEQRTQ